MSLWTRPDRQTETDSLLLTRDRWFELTNESAECVQPATTVSTPKAQRTGRSPIAECFSDFLKPELPFDHPEGWMECRNYVALQIWYFYGDSLHCVVTRERFVGLTRLESPAFLRFKWRKNTANKTEPKTRLKRPRIAPKLQTRHKDNPMLR